MSVQGGKQDRDQEGACKKIYTKKYTHRTRHRQKGRRSESGEVTSNVKNRESGGSKLEEEDRSSSESDMGPSFSVCVSLFHTTFNRPDSLGDCQCRSPKMG